MTSAAEMPDTESAPEEPPGGGEPARVPGGIPEATVARLPVYLRALYTLAERGASTVSSDDSPPAPG